MKITISTAKNLPDDLTCFPENTPENAVLKMMILSREFPPVQVVEPLKLRCAWCDEETGITEIGENISHRICPRHLVSNLVFCNRADTFDALYYTVIGLLSEVGQ